MLKNKAFLLLLLTLVLLLTAVNTAGAQAGRRITWYVISSGGGPIHSAHYALNATMGQAAPGVARSTNFTLGSGFWYVMGVPKVAQLYIFLPALLKRYP